MSIVYPIRWRLLYGDGRQLDEAPAGSSIMERWPDPSELHLFDITGQSVMCVPIPSGQKPIFYRRRSMGLNVGNGDPSLDATVFGYGSEGAETGNAKLWAWSQSRAINCPQGHISWATIKVQIQ